MSINILDEMKNDFLISAKEINNNRAFPDSRDGLKVSQRACLWEMYSKGYSSDKPHVKSAKVDGGVIANWHPHGSEYSTFGRMSQKWNNNICEVDWHGANGSQLGGDELAASRYTECRLSHASEDGFFSNIKKDTVDFIPNFSEDLEWPSVLPAIFPRLFVNGSQGIGYTIAQEWEPSNLKEFTQKVKGYLKNKKVICTDIYPDYSTGGIIINKDDIHTIYETGKGNIILRAKTEINGNTIKITELPYQVYVEPLIQKIKDLVNNDGIEGIEDICNKSDDYGLLIEIECNSDPNKILNKLFTLTDLQCTFSANQMALVNGVPTLLTLKDYIKVYVEHNIECLQREYKFDLEKSKTRLEIVEGLIKAIDQIDLIIDTIKKSKNSTTAREAIEQLGYTQAQAQAISDMRLSRLANMETKSLNIEYEELNKEVNKCEQMLGSEENQKDEFMSRLVKFTEKYGWERRTQLDQIDLVKEKVINKKSPKSEEQYMIVLTKGNYIKRIKMVDYKPQSKVKLDSDIAIGEVRVKSKSRVILISESGKLYRLQANKINLCTINSTGTSLHDLLNENIISLYNGDETEPFIFMTSSQGLVKKMSTEILFKISKLAGTVIFKLKDGDKLIDTRLVNDNDEIKLRVSGKDKILNVSDFIDKGKSAGGVKGIKLKDKVIESVS